MAWTTPRTWRPLEMNGAGWMNAQVRDNENVLKTCMDDAGALKTLVKGFAYSAGQGSGGGAVDTYLNSFAVTIPADFMRNAGDALVVEGLFATSADVGTKVLKVAVDDVPTLATVYSNATVSLLVAFRYVIRYRTATTGSVVGACWGSTATLAALTVGPITNVALTAAWDDAQVLKFYANTTAANELIMQELFVNSARTITGSLV